MGCIHPKGYYTHPLGRRKNEKEFTFAFQCHSILVKTLHILLCTPFNNIVLPVCSY